MTPPTPSEAAGRAAVRKLRQDIFIRVCRDSGFQLEATRAASLAALIIGCHPLDIWMSMDISLMNRIASGEHPAAHREAAA